MQKTEEEAAPHDLVLWLYFRICRRINILLLMVCMYMVRTEACSLHKAQVALPKLDL